MNETNRHSEVLTQDLSQWIGKSQVMEDRIELKSARLMQQTLNRHSDLSEGDPLPPAWHWLYFIDSVKLSETDHDGHSKRGDFLPPVSLPRRMWAGSRLRFHEPLRLGEIVTRESIIQGIEQKKGQSGPLCFVTVSHSYRRNKHTLLEEEHDIVYRSAPTSGMQTSTPPPADRQSHIQRTVHPSPLLLFRYSALTFNGHRIHYDIDYCRDVEGYPDLIVHGPLTVTLLLDMLVQEVGQASIRRFSFRAKQPLFANKPFTMHLNRDNDKSCELWVANPEHHLAVLAKAELN